MLVPILFTDSKIVQDGLKYLTDEDIKVVQKTKCLCKDAIT